MLRMEKNVKTSNFKRQKLERVETYDVRQDDYFRVTHDHFWSKRHFFEAAGTASKIFSPRHPNQTNLAKLNLSKSKGEEGEV